jgi:hypothetical protein
LHFLQLSQFKLVHTKDGQEWITAEMVWSKLATQAGHSFVMKVGQVRREGAKFYHLGKSSQLYLTWAKF